MSKVIKMCQRMRMFLSNFESLNPTPHRIYSVVEGRIEDGMKSVSNVMICVVYDFFFLLFGFKIR